MTAYLSIDPQQEPFDVRTLDGAGRVQYAFNVLALKRPSATFVEELIHVLVAAGVGVANVSIFGSTLAVLPDTGTVLEIVATGGTPPIGTHNAGAGAYRRPGAQITVHAETAPEAAAMAEAAYTALLGVRNQAVVA